MPVSAVPLADEVRAHPALRHPFLLRFSEGVTREQARAFGLQHYQLVRHFTGYMTNLGARRPAWGQALRPVLDDELGGHTIFRSHVHLYRNFLRSLGLDDPDWGGARPAHATRRFISGHRELTAGGDPLAGLGAIGPGHELAIPVMFEFLIRGLRQIPGLAPNLEYFTLHIKEDQEHARVFEGVIRQECRADASALERIRQGTLWSLERRAEFWDACRRLVFGSPE